jgi:2-hydroxychromene-2-carboxylate isomerase
MRTLDYYFAPASPWTYLGHQRFEEMARRHGAKIAYKPCDFGRVFAASGGLPLAQRPKQRQSYRLAELKRWRNFLGVPLTIQPKHFPVSSDLPARAIVAAPEEARGRASFAIMRGCWAEERNIADRETLAELLGREGLDGAKILAAAESDAAKRALDANTEEAIERQVFGAPTYIVDGELFWGQDRLDFVERALAKR